MKLDGLNEQVSTNSLHYHDNSALMNIKNSHEQGQALEVVAGQFEAMFLQMVLRQMRSSSDVLADKDSPFSSQQYSVFRDMYDGQLAIEMARKQNSGIADMLIKQLSPSAIDVEFATGSLGPSANDGLTAVEETSQLGDKQSQKVDATLHSRGEVVASVKEIFSEVGATTAFAQPLIRTMEL